MPGLFGPTVAEIQQSINERGKAEDLQRASLPRGRGPVLAGASFGRNLGQMLFGQPNNPDLQKARGLQEVEQSVRQTVAENNIQDPSLILEISKKMLLERGFIQEALMVHQKSVEANKAQLEQRRASAEATKSEVGARVAGATEQSQIEMGQMAPEVAQQQLDTSKQQQETSRVNAELSKAKQRKIEFELSQLKTLSGTISSPLTALSEETKGLSDKVKLLATYAKIKSDPALKASLGGDIGEDTLRAVIQDMSEEDMKGMSVTITALIKKKSMATNGQGTWTDTDELFLNELKEVFLSVQKQLMGPMLRGFGGSQAQPSTPPSGQVWDSQQGKFVPR